MKLQWPLFCNSRLVALQITIIKDKIMGRASMGWASGWSALFLVAHMVTCSSMIGESNELRSTNFKNNKMLKNFLIVKYRSSRYVRCATGSHVTHMVFKL